MCNNIRMNELKIQRKETKVLKDKISDWIEDRAFNVLRNKNAIEKRMTISDGVRYIKGYPLKLNNGTKVRTIRTEKIDEDGKDKGRKIRVLSERSNNRIFTRW